MATRPDGRTPDQLRPIEITRKFTKYAAGSVLISQGETKVLCTASIEESVPPFRKESGKGWITGEYSMLPSSTQTRKVRESKIGRVEGRTHEIQRLIGRSMRSVVNLSLLGERTIWIDADVLQADGGTRTAAITGSYVALVDALAHLKKMKLISDAVDAANVAAVSVGVVGGVPVLDLCYEEDVSAQVDMNVVMTGEGQFIEVQGTGEECTFDQEELSQMLDLAKKGITELIKAQNDAIATATDD